MSWGSTASSDHYLAFDGDGLPGPTGAWVTLGALARETSRVSSTVRRAVSQAPKASNSSERAAPQGITTRQRRQRGEPGRDRVIDACGPGAAECAWPNSRTGTRPYSGCVRGPAAESAGRS
jgi:hypothetical protein